MRVRERSIGAERCFSPSPLFRRPLALGGGRRSGERERAIRASRVCWMRSRNNFGERRDWTTLLSARR